MTIPLRQALPPAFSCQPEPPGPRRARGGPRGVPIWHCSRWGLPCRSCCPSRGGLLPHRFTLARRPVSVARPWRPAVCSLWRFPSGCPGRALPGTVVLWSPDFPRGLRPRGHPAIRANLQLGVRTAPVNGETGGKIGDGTHVGGGQRSPGIRAEPLAERAQNHVGGMCRVVSEARGCRQKSLRIGVRRRFRGVRPDRQVLSRQAEASRNAARDRTCGRVPCRNGRSTPQPRLTSGP